MARPTQIISSPSNPLLKDIRHAVSRGTTTSNGFWVAESFHLLEEALRSGTHIEVVLASATALLNVNALLNGRGVGPARAVDDFVFERLAATETTQGVIALVRPPKWSLEQLFGERALVAVLDGIQDPGNAGTIVRSAEAFGASGAMFLSGTAKSANPKTLRASAGSLFRLPCVEGIAPDKARDRLEERGVRVFAASSGPSCVVKECNLAGPCAVVFGSEARGVSAPFQGVAESLHVPTRGVDSLNVAAAAAVILYEAARQRSQTQQARSRPEDFQRRVS